MVPVQRRWNATVLVVRDVSIEFLIPWLLLGLLERKWRTMVSLNQQTEAVTVWGVSWVEGNRWLGAAGVAN